MAVISSNWPKKDTEIVGKLITCGYAGCNEFIFVKEIERDVKAYDGGYTHVDHRKYEDPPDGWGTYEFATPKSSLIFRTFCPKHSKHLMDAVSGFFVSARN